MGAALECSTASIGSRPTPSIRCAMSCARFSAPVLQSTLLMWALTVFVAIDSVRASSLVSRPRSSRRVTRSSM